VALANPTPRSYDVADDSDCDALGGRHDWECTGYFEGESCASEKKRTLWMHLRRCERCIYALTNKAVYMPLHRRGKPKPTSNDIPPAAAASCALRASFASLLSISQQFCEFTVNFTVKSNKWPVPWISNTLAECATTSEAAATPVTCAPPPDEHTPEVSNALHKETFTRHAALAIILHSQALAIILNSHSMPPPSRRRSKLRVDFGHPNVLCDGGLQ